MRIETLLECRAKQNILKDIIKDYFEKRKAINTIYEDINKFYEDFLTRCTVQTDFPHRIREQSQWVAAPFISVMKENEEWWIKISTVVCSMPYDKIFECYVALCLQPIYFDLNKKLP